MSIIGTFKHPDTGEELLAVRANAGKARYPRGIYLYSLSEEREVWRYEFTAFFDGACLIDLYGDKEIESLIYCSSTANGGDSNGFDDNHSYVFALETKGTIKWKRVLGGKFTNVAATPLTWSGGKSTKVTSTALRGLGDEVRIVAKVDVGTGFEATRPRLLLLEGSTGRALDSIYYDGQILSRLVATEEPEENSWAVFCSMRNRILRKYRATDKEITFVKEKRFSKGNCFCCHRFF